MCHCRRLYNDLARIHHYGACRNINQLWLFGAIWDYVVAISVYINYLAFLGKCLIHVCAILC